MQWDGGWERSIDPSTSCLRDFIRSKSKRGELSSRGRASASELAWRAEIVAVRVIVAINPRRKAAAFFIFARTFSPRASPLAAGSPLNARSDRGIPLYGGATARALIQRSKNLRWLRAKKSLRVRGRARVEFIVARALKPRTENEEKRAARARGSCYNSVSLRDSPRNPALLAVLVASTSKRCAKLFISPRILFFPETRDSPVYLLACQEQKPPAI